MKLVPRFLRREEPQETKCPRCGISAPINALECTACGWDLRDAYHGPVAGEPIRSEGHEAGRY